MISVIVGVCLGYWVQRRKLGLVLSLIYGLLIGLPASLGHLVLNDSRRVRRAAKASACGSGQRK